MSEATQTFYAVLDPCWGEPRVIPETVQSTADGAIDVFLSMAEYGIWTGARQYPQPGGTQGKMTRAVDQGFKVVTFVLNPDELEEV